jgi:hypothetical protein
MEYAYSAVGLSQILDPASAEAVARELFARLTRFHPD